MAATHFRRNQERIAEEEQRAREKMEVAVERFNAATGTGTVPFQFAGDDPDEKATRKASKK